MNIRGNEERKRAIQRYGLDTMYAEQHGTSYETWTYSDGQRHFLKTFATLEGLQSWAERHRYGIIYVNPPARRPRRTKRRAGLIKDMRFFREHGAMIVGEGSRVGLDLARAEREMKKRGWDHAFVPEDQSYEDVYGEKPPEDAEFATVVLLDTEFNDRWTERELWSHVIGSLGFVDTRDRKYVRVVVAELALEALAQPRRLK